MDKVYVVERRVELSEEALRTAGVVPSEDGFGRGQARPAWVEVWEGEASYSAQAFERALGTPDEGETATSGHTSSGRGFIIAAAGVEAGRYRAFEKDGNYTSITYRDVETPRALLMRDAARTTGEHVPAVTA